MKYRTGLLLSILVFSLAIHGCVRSPSQTERTVTPSPSSQTLVFYNWPGYIPQSVLDAFTEETAVRVDYRSYDSQEQAVQNLRDGQVYDVVVIGSHLLPSVISQGLLADIDFRNVPNIRNISPNFRDLAVDPGNRHSVLYQWGTTGIIVRTDRVIEPVTRWADLWDTRYAGRVGVWPLQRDLIGIALKSLGYSYNSEDPHQLQQASERLEALKANAFQVDPALSTAESYLLEKDAVMIHGWTFDALAARSGSPNTAYVLPEEGTILWGDNFAIPANSPHKALAEQFINFLLRPEISAQIVNETFSASSNEAANSFIRPEILNDPAIYPPEAVRNKGEWLLPLSPAGKQLFDQIWEQVGPPGL